MVCPHLVEQRVSATIATAFHFGPAPVPITESPGAPIIYFLYNCPMKKLGAWILVFPSEGVMRPDCK
jgi:hypothetical protein